MPQEPYQDVELCAGTGHAHPALARAVAYEVASCSTTNAATLEVAQTGAEDMVRTLTALAQPGSRVRCLFRLTGHGIRIRVRVSADQHLRGLASTASTAVQALPDVVENASTIAVPDDGNTTAIISDALVPL